MNKSPESSSQCKLKAKDISPHLKYFKTKFPKVECVQVHLYSKKGYETKEGIKSLNWNTFLKDLI